MVHPDDRILFCAEKEMICQGMKRHGENMKEANTKSLQAI